MKKIRLLALLLAILMIPMAFLFACKDEEEDPEEEEEEEEEEGGKKPTTPGFTVTYDDDGTKDLYHMYFHFDAAKPGMLGIVPKSDVATSPESEYKLTPPYSDYLEGKSLKGVYYTIRNAGGRQFFAMERRDVMADPTLTIKVGDAFGSDINADHVISFDVCLEKGIINSDVSLIGYKNDKGYSLTFLTVSDGLLLDGTGAVIYGDKDTDKKGWIRVSVAVNENSAARFYNIAVDGIKQTENVTIPASYQQWVNYKVDSYAFVMKNDSSKNCYFYIDNLAVANGTVSYTGSDRPTSAKETIQYSYLADNHGLDYTGFFDFIEDWYSTNGGSKNTPFSMSKLMSSCMTISKVAADGKTITDLYDDYGVWLGKYGEEAVLVNSDAQKTDSFKVTVNPTVYNAYFQVNVQYFANSEATAVEGVAATAEDGVITFTWAGAAPKVGEDAMAYGKYSAETDVLTIYKEEACTTALGSYALQTLASRPAYAPEVGEGEELVIKLSNFSPYKTLNFPYDEEWHTSNFKKYDKYVFEFYADKKMVDDGFQFMIIFDCGTVDGKYTYAYAKFDSDEFAEGILTGKDFRYKEGWNRFELDINNLNTSGAWSSHADVKSMAFKFGGWANHPTVDPDGDKEKVNDGYTMYFKQLRAVTNINVDVTLPDYDKTDCTHPEFVDVAEPIPANCQHGSYYVQQCTNCHATRVDHSKPISLPGNHTLDRVQHNDPTCTESGYDYQLCTVCGERIIDESTVVPENGHNWSITYDAVSRIENKVCRVCGQNESKRVYAAMISFPEKIAAVGIPKTQYVYTDDVVNPNANMDAGTGGTGYSVSEGTFGTGSLRSATIQSVSAGTDKMFKYTVSSVATMTDGKANYHTHFGFTPNVSGTDFVYEIDIMLGTPKSDGAYLTTNMQCLDTVTKASGATRTEMSMFGTDAAGNFRLDSSFIKDSPVLVKLSESKATNLAIVFRVSTNEILLYADGILVQQSVFKGAAIYGGSLAKVTFSEMRYNISPNSGYVGCSLFFDNLCWYTSAAPACVVADVPLLDETSGPLKLFDELGAEIVSEFGVYANHIDVKANLGVGIFTTKYVLEFTVEGANYTDGVLLQGIKNATGYDRTQALLEIKNGKLYSFGKMICAMDESVKLGLIFNDQYNTLNVYVDGELVDGTVDYSEYTEYSYSNARVRSFVFCNDCGDYTVSGLKLYTGTEIQK